MSMPESFDALRRANPRNEAGFRESVDAAADIVRGRIAPPFAPDLPRIRPAPRRRFVRISVAGAALALAAVVAVSLTVGSPGSGSGVEDAAAAMRKAAARSAASAEQSGTAIVRITENGELWAGSTLRWHDDDLAVSQDAPRRAGRHGSDLLVVGGTMYGIDPRGGRAVVLGSVKSIDPGSGTTPAEYLAAVREDVGGATLRRITDGMTGLTKHQLDNGSTVYSGTVAAGLVARKSGFKEGRPIRLLPFGYVAHGEAADPASPLAVAVTVGTDSVVREIAVSWGTSASAWEYRVRYSGLGATGALVAPANPRPLRERLRAGK
jgi:hypothetical protein